MARGTRPCLYRTTAGGSPWVYRIATVAPTDGAESKCGVADGWRADHTPAAGDVEHLLGSDRRHLLTDTRRGRLSPLNSMTAPHAP